MPILHAASLSYFKLV